MQSILRIDLTTRNVDSFNVPADMLKEYIGGSALAARLLYDSITPELDPLSAQAPLLFLNGPLSGTAGPAVGRFVVCGKSPATGLWGESNCGGFWGPELRMAGWDGLWLTGKSETPVYISINDRQVEIRDATRLWGQDTYEVQSSIKAELNQKGARVLNIGIAGELLIPFALLLCDHGRVAGRTGMGAVMGSKNVKAIAVHGTGKVPVTNPELFKSHRSESNRALKKDPMTNVLHDLGSAGGADYFDYLGTMPKKYYSAGTLENTEKITGSAIADSILVGTTACHACVIACGRVVKLEDGEKRKGPEYETIIGFGPNIGVTDPAVPTRLGEWCDVYGVDTISMSNTIGLAFYLYEQGLLTDKDTDGLKLNWGNAEAAEKLIHLTIKREGIGQWLALGARAFGKHFNAEEHAVQVNGLELAYHDPRGASGMALAYATSPRGACHNQSDYFIVDLGQAETDINIQFFDRRGGAEKSANVARHQDWRTVNNAMVLCVFANVPPESMLSLINAAEDFNFSMDEMIRCGERAWNLKRAINNRLGLNRANDKLPKALLEPLAEGGASDYVIPLEEMLSAYYQARGWDEATGKPLKTKLTELNLGWVVKDLYL